MSQQKPILLLKNKRTNCTICNSGHKKLIDELLYEGLPEKEVMRQLEIKEIYEISISMVRSHLRYHIDNTRMMVARSKWTADMEHILAEKREAKLIGHKEKLSTEAKINKTVKETQESANLPDMIKEVNMTPKEKKDLHTVQNQIRKKRRDLNLLDEMVYVMELNKERLEQSRDNEVENECVLGITSKIADSHFKNAVKMHEITSGMNSLKDVRLAEITVMLTNVMFRHEVSDITRFDMFRVFKMFQHVGLNAEDVAKDSQEAIKFEHAHSFAEIQNKMDYNKAFAEQTLKESNKPIQLTQKDNVNIQKDNVNNIKSTPTKPVVQNEEVSNASDLMRQFRGSKKKTTTKKTTTPKIVKKGVRPTKKTTKKSKSVLKIKGKI